MAESVDSLYRDGIHRATGAEAIGEVEAATQRTSGQSLGKPNGWILGASALALALLVLAFGPTFRTLWRTWLGNDNYSHGFLILPVTLFMVWTARRDLATLPARSSWLGLPVLLVGMALHLAGMRGDVTIFQGWGFVAIVAGLVWTWFGTRIAWRLSFPILFLLFMVPALPIFMNQVSFRLKEVAANGSVHLAQILGAPVVQQGDGPLLPDRDAHGGERVQRDELAHYADGYGRRLCVLRVRTVLETWPPVSRVGSDRPRGECGADHVDLPRRIPARYADCVRSCARR
ncbi:MAG: exosortase/archaeosortase family protein [Candidatus Eisenbacteria bacterium]